ncbi:MAG: winged helix-turn-helix transcriptional regulator [Nitrospinota bacterium]
MEKDGQRTFQLLTEIDKDNQISQRTLSIKLGIALGLTNSIMKRCVKKGYIKITTIPKSRIKYLITPKGFSEKARLTYHYLQYTIQFYRDARERIRGSFKAISGDGIRDVIFYGAGEVAEISFISLAETNLRLVAVIDDYKKGGNFFGMPIYGREKLNEINYDLVIITSFRSADTIYKILRDIRKVPLKNIFLLNDGFK